MIYSTMECDICHKAVSDREDGSAYCTALHTWMVPHVSAIVGRHHDALGPHSGEGYSDSYVCSVKCLKVHLQKIIDDISESSLYYPPNEKKAR